MHVISMTVLVHPELPFLRFRANCSGVFRAALPRSKLRMLARRKAGNCVRKFRSLAVLSDQSTMAYRALIVPYIGQCRLASMLRVAAGTCGRKGLIAIMVEHRVTFAAGIVLDGAQVLVLACESLPGAECFDVASIAILVEHRMRCGNWSRLINEFRPGPNGKWKGKQGRSDK